jgi:hypothetical protein
VRKRLVQAVGVALLLAACTSSPLPRPTNDCPERVQPSTHPGAMYVLVGPVVNGLPLARLDFQTGCLSLIAPHVATIHTNGRQVVGDDVTQVGAPTIGEVVDGELRSVSDPDLRGMMPAVSADGRIASIVLNYPGAELDTWDPATGKNTKILEVRRELTRPQWGPHGSILLLWGTGPRTKLVSVDRHGTPHDLLATPGARWMDLSSRGFVDVTDYASKTTVFDLRTGKRHVIHGWYGMGWDPGGTTLVLAQKRGTFGFSSAPNFGTVSDVLRLPRGFLAGTAWVAQSSTSTD